MQLHILNNPKDAALAADAEFLKQSLYKLLHEEASPLVVETVKLLSTSDDSAALIEKVLPQLDEQQTHDLTLARGLFAQILNIAKSTKRRDTAVRKAAWRKRYANSKRRKSAARWFKNN